MTAPDMHGRLLSGRYRLVAQLGRGGMGTVWRAEDEMLGRVVAIKEVTLPPELSDEDGAVLRQRTMREARTAARLNHPNVVTLFDVVEENGRPWIVMEFVPSRSLAQVVSERGPLSPQRVAGIGLLVLKALRAAHAAGILHRDVKPSNVLLADDGRVVLTDFGIATTEGDSSLTRSGSLLGSPGYIAPERARGNPATPASDLWSLGATLYTAVEGKPPYDRTGAMAILAALITEDPDPPDRAGVLWPVLERMLHRDPVERPDAVEVESLLRQVAAGTTGEHPVVSPGAAPVAGGRRSEVAGRTRVLPLPPPGPPSPAEKAPPPALAGGEPASVASVPVASVATAAPTGLAPGAGAAGTTGAGRRRRGLPAWWPAAVAGLVILALVGAVVALQRPGAENDAQPNAVGQTSSLSSPSAASPTATSPSSAVTTPSAATSPRTPSAGPTASPTYDFATARYSRIPTGYYRYVDRRTGFSLAVPNGWQYRLEDGRVRFSEPGGARFLLVDQTDRPKPDPVADWETQEDSRLAQGHFPGYQRIRIVAVDYFLKAADWELTYNRGGRLHVLNRGFVTSPNKAYSLYWSTPESQWEASKRHFEVFAATFQPAR